MIKILTGIWKRKVKIIDEDALFNAVFGVVMVVATLLTGACQIFLLKENEYVLLLLLNAFLMIYNKPTILSHIYRRRCASFMVDKKVFAKYIVFQFLRENVLVIIAGLSNIVLLVYSLFFQQTLPVLAIIILSLDVYLLEIYQGQKKVILAGIMVCMVGWMINYNPVVLALLIISNCVFAGAIFYAQSLEKVFANMHRNVHTASQKVTIFRVDMLYFLRMPLQDIAEILFEILIVFVLWKYIDVSIISYLLIALFMVEIEMLQDAKMKEYDIFYGKRNFLEFSRFTGLKRFLISLEFNYVIKYSLLTAVLFALESRIVGIKPLFLFSCINLLLLIFAVAYRYDRITDFILCRRQVIEHTWVRMVMLYLVLFNMTPFLFEKTLQGIKGYREIYGYIFALVVNLFLLFVKVEKIIKISDGEVYDKSRE